MDTRFELDTVDLRILRVLQANGRANQYDGRGGQTSAADGLG